MDNLIYKKDFRSDGYVVHDKNIRGVVGQGTTKEDALSDLKRTLNQIKTLRKEAVQIDLEQSHVYTESMLTIFIRISNSDYYQSMSQSSKRRVKDVTTRLKWMEKKLRELLYYNERTDEFSK